MLGRCLDESTIPVELVIDFLTTLGISQMTAPKQNEVHACDDVTGGVVFVLKTNQGAIDTEVTLINVRPHEP